MADATFAALTSERLVLRRFRPDDLEAFVAYRSNPEIARYQFAVALRRTGRLIGDCAAHVRADDPRLAEVGFTLAPEHHGYGYATEAVRRLLHYLLIERGKHRVSATCDDRNAPSAAVLERVGMRREGHLLESTWSKGEWTSDLVYAVLRREWADRPGVPWRG